MKQDTLAEELGISQQSVSPIEPSENLKEDLRQPVSKVLGVSPEGFKRYSEGTVINHCNIFWKNN